MRHILRSFAVAVGSTLTLVAVAGVAEATVYTPVEWGPVSSSYDGQTVVEASGTFYNASNVSATNEFWINDPADDGNNVYGHTKFLYYNGSFWLHATKSTGEYSYANTPVTTYLSDDLQANSWKARGQSFACAQLGWPVPDSCSDSALPTFDY